MEEFVVNIEFTVGELNGLVNLLNRPWSASVSDCIYFINLAQQQGGPQITKAQESVDAVKKAMEENNKNEE